MAKRHTPDPSPTGTFESLDLMAAVEKRLTQRQMLQDEIAAIDAELRRVFELIGQDRPAAVVAAPAAPAPVPAAAVAPSPRVCSSVQRATRERAALAVRPERRSLADDQILLLVKRGHQSPRDIYGHMPTRSRETVKAALRRAVDMGRLVRTGKTVSTRYSLPQAPQTTSASARRTVVSDGVEYESVFDGSRGQSLLGDRDSRGSSLAVNA